jgi:DNA-binding MarR family transcriptional regulator
MGQAMGEHPFSAELSGDSVAFVESELRRLCDLLGFRMEPLASRTDTKIMPVGFTPSAAPGFRREPSAIAQQRRTRARLVRNEIKRRRQRDRFFPSELFADPAWDILLDLYAADYEGRRISVSSACIAAAVPATTALRWLKTLTDNGQIERVPDEADGRRILVAISEAARLQLDAYFDEFEED